MPEQTLSYVTSCAGRTSPASAWEDLKRTPKLSHFPPHFLKTHRVKFLLPSSYVLPGEIKKSRHHNVKTWVHFIPLRRLHIRQIIPEQWIHISSPNSYSTVSSQGTPVCPVFYHWLSTIPTLFPGLSPAENEASHKSCWTHLSPLGGVGRIIKSKTFRLR